MIYVMSDLHGCYEDYIKMLKLINFNDSDYLYILGDVCDRGKQSMEILLHMMEHENIIPIFGNHDLSSYPHLVKSYNGNLEYNKEFLWWVTDGGRETLGGFEKLPRNKQDKVLSYIEEFRYYEEINIHGQDYLLVHGGLRNFDKNKPISEYKLYDLVWERPNYDIVYFDDKIIISGHTPTLHIDKNMKGKIIKKNNHIAIDCGCVFGYGLGCLCLDTMEEFYVYRDVK